MLSEHERQQIIARYRAGESGVTLAAAFHVRPAAIYSIARRAGLDPKRRGVSECPEHRVCRRCHIEKPITAFASIGTRSGPKSREYVCRECLATYMRENGISLRYNTGLTLQQYNELLAQQGDGCAICGTPPRRQRLSVDHDHDTGVIRGLLCHRCNTRMQALDDPAWVAKAASYRTTAKTPYRWKQAG